MILGDGDGEARRGREGAEVAIATREARGPRCAQVRTGRGVRGGREKGMGRGEGWRRNLRAGIGATEGRQKRGWTEKEVGSGFFFSANPVSAFWFGMGTGQTLTPQRRDDRREACGGRIVDFSASLPVSVVQIRRWSSPRELWHTSRNRSGVAQVECDPGEDPPAGRASRLTVVTNGRPLTERRLSSGAWAPRKPPLQTTRQLADATDFRR